MLIAAYVVAALLLLAIVLAPMSLRIAREYERGVVFRLGRLIQLKGPGLFFIFPFGIDRLIKVDLRVITLEVPPQEVITLDKRDRQGQRGDLLPGIGPAGRDHARRELPELDLPD